jgi:hypothetical protein
LFSLPLLPGSLPPHTSCVSPLLRACLPLPLVTLPSCYFLPSFSSHSTPSFFPCQNFA